MSDSILLTKEGLEKLRKELNDLKSVQRPEIARQIAEAREKGDLSENAEYDAAKEAQGMLELKINKLEDTLAKARVIDERLVDTSKVSLLSTVEIENQSNKRVMKYTLVSESEADLKQGKISTSSPVGKGLMGKKVGEIAEIQTPGGLVKFKILNISFG